MNFLAHSFLSGFEKEILLGNFIADAVKGRRFEEYDRDVRKGILLHRIIDDYTDSHEIFLQSKHRLTEPYGKYSGVIADIYYDHFLSKFWDDYSDTDLRSYVSWVYLLLNNNYQLIPPRFRRILPYLVYDNWLVGYSDFTALKRVFYGMDRRTGFRSGMKDAVGDLKADYDQYKNEFQIFFADIIEEVSRIKNGSIKNGQQGFAAQKKIDSLLNG